jgi:hypothetical protein
LLASGLSQRGQSKALTIMSLEQVLQDLEGPDRRFPRDPELYFVSIFGTPGPKATWGWRVEGHHLALNFTIVNGAFVSGTPSFMGSNPAEIRSGPRLGLRALAAEEDLGRELIQSLNATQRKTAIFAEKAPADIITGAVRKASPLDQVGLAANDLSADQLVVLKRVIEEYVRRNRPELANADLVKIQDAGYNKVYFAWAGGLEKGDPHYYRVQGPTFLLEYDSTQNEANHVHAVWRDFNGDFGEDLLRKHYDATPHP